MRFHRLLPWLVLVATCVAIWLVLAPHAKADPPINAQTVSNCGTPNNAAIVGVTYPVTMDTGANLCVGSTNPSVGLNNATAPGSSTQVGIQVGGNLQAVSAGNPLPVSGSFTINGSTNNIGNVGVNQGSTTSGQIGPLVQCAVTTSAPTYVSGQTSPLSCDTSGTLRTTAGGGGGGGAVFGPTATGSAPANPPVLTAGWDNTNLHTLLTDTAGRVVVTGAYNIGSAAPSSSIAPAIVASDGTNSRLLKTDTSGNLQANVLQINGVAPLMGNGVTGTGSQRVTIASDNTAFSVNAQPATSGGLSICYLLAANTTNSTNCKGSAGQVYHIRIFNNSANIAYLKLYNKATAPTCGTDTAVDQIMVPGVTGGTGVVSDIALGEAFATGIGFCLTGGFANADTTAVAASAFSVTILYK